MSKATPARLTSAQEKTLSIARIAFMMEAPFYAHLYHSLGKEVITRDLPSLATDGRRILINPEYFCGLSVSEQVFALAHEMAHLVMRHPQRMTAYRRAGKLRDKPYIQKLGNICADYVINAGLIESHVGSCNPNWLYDKDIKGDELWEDVYERLWVDPPCPPVPPPGKGSEDGEGEGPPGGDGVNDRSKPGHEPVKAGKKVSATGKPDKLAEANDGAFDEVWEPEVDPATGEVDVPEEHEFKEAVARAAAVAKAMGKLPGNVQRMVDEILAPQVDWREHIRLTMTGKVGARGETWKKLNRRRLVLTPTIILPGRNSYGCELVVVGVDTSGSIGDNELNVFLSEVSGILADVKPRRIMVIGCDYVVTQVDEVDSLDAFEVLRAKGIKGGGGTRFEPVMDYVKEHDLRPEMMVYLTDGVGDLTFPAPPYPVVWAMTTDVEASWGEVVRIKV
jgi:predicted metal-dependent peptidase